MVHTIRAGRLSCYPTWCKDSHALTFGSGCLNHGKADRPIHTKYCSLGNELIFFATLGVSINISPEGHPGPQGVEHQGYVLGEALAAAPCP